ncbi:MAG: aldehyde dehydrogenase family protein [Tepidisphaerales bacterium]
MANRFLPSSPLAVHIGGAARAGRATGDRGTLRVRCPIDGAELASMTAATPADVADAVAAAHDAFLKWRVVPAPVRGELVRRVGNAVRAHKAALAEVITLEAGKITQEALGEVQEWIDMCDFAVGLSRQLHGLTIASERPSHRMMEQWHPLGAVGVISAFNFPMAVWAWNAMLALVCGDSVVWKPSEKTPLSALAAHAVLQEAADGFEPARGLALSSVVVGGADVGEALAADPRLPLISATGSTRMGQRVAQVVGARLGRCLLELGGNNAMIVTPSADLELAIRAIAFAAVGTAGQRCTSLRRLIVHESIKEAVLSRLERVYSTLTIGDPRGEGVLVGPLIDEAAARAFEDAITAAIAQGGKVRFGGGRAPGVAGGVYVRPVVVEVPNDPVPPIVQHETFAPLLYVLSYSHFDQAIALHNDVPQGLSSAIFTSDLLEAERFLSPAGSDCGIANVNIGTSGAEIGGAFGGEKATGGGRESGSDAWKNYMRRATNTINYGKALPLAQGIRFDV